MSDVIVKTIFGSHVYGANVATSDTDLKFIFQPQAKDILLSRQANHKSFSTKNSSEKRQNTQDDVDNEGFSLQQYLKLLSEGQTLALDVLFTPPEFILEKTELWDYIQQNKDKLLSKKISAFVGYCRAQASKYCVKADRINAVEQVLNILQSHNQNLKVEEIQSEIEQIKSEFIDWEQSEQFIGIQCCGRKAQATQTIRKAVEIYQNVFESYGNRVLLSKQMGAKDWKALYHSVRIGRQAEELLNTHHITFPRPEKDLLIKVRTGQLEYQQVSDIIEQQLVVVEDCLVKSTLPSNCNQKFIDELIMEQNLKEIDKWRVK